MRRLTADNIRDIAIKSGFKLKEQPNGEMDLNPYVFDFAQSLTAELEKRLAEVERERDDYKRIAIDAATESFLIAADNEIKRALEQDNKSASAINHCQQQFHRAARSCAIDCVNNQLRKQLNGGE